MPGVRPSLSIDAETNVPTTMFAQMQLCLAAQRVALTQRKAQGEKDVPKPISARDVIEFATIEGAKACGLEGKDRVAHAGQAGGYHPAAQECDQRAAGE